MNDPLPIKQPVSLFVFLTMRFLAACTGPQPVLYPNDHYQAVGEAQADQDVAACRAFADEHLSSGEGEKVAGRTVMGAGVGAASGAVGGAVTGSPGTGAAIGAAAGATAGFLRGLLGAAKPTRAYMNFVNRCLMEKGYDPTGWE